jgi:hypothetical protein
MAKPSFLLVLEKNIVSPLTIIFNYQREDPMEKSLNHLVKNLEILDVRSSVQEILRENDEEHKDVLELHEEHD